MGGRLGDGGDLYKPDLEKSLLPSVIRLRIGCESLCVRCEFRTPCLQRRTLPFSAPIPPDPGRAGLTNFTSCLQAAAAKLRDHCASGRPRRQIATEYPSSAAEARTAAPTTTNPHLSPRERAPPTPQPLPLRPRAQAAATRDTRRDRTQP